MMEYYNDLNINDSGLTKSHNMELVKQTSLLFEALKNLLGDIEALMAESTGVTGLLVSGNLALWNELTDGGRLEWIQLNPARKALATVDELRKKI